MKKNNLLILTATLLLTLTSCGVRNPLLDDTIVNDELYHTCSLIYLDELMYVGSFNFKDGINYDTFLYYTNIDSYLEERRELFGKEMYYNYSWVLDIDKETPLSEDTFDSSKSFNLYFY